jgi:succinate dehydrogenase / fumarate reductase, cytochrome b subunit
VAASRAAQPAGIYATAVGKKYAMAISGIVLMAFVLAHMVGNLKLYFGASPMDRYSHWLRTVGEPALPAQGLLYAERAVLLAALVVHVHAAYALTRINRRARPDVYRSRRDYVAADFASRTMRWTGVIVLLFVAFHLLDLTWGPANPRFVDGDPYGNVVASFQRWPVALVYVAANLALALHLYHGAWSLFQSMGWSHPRWNRWRRRFAVAFTVIVAGGNISFPIAVLTGVIG